MILFLELKNTKDNLNETEIRLIVFANYGRNAEILNIALKLIDQHQKPSVTA